MNSSVPIPSFNDTAFLVLDKSGVVRAANDSAGRLWQTKPEALTGQLVVSLFAFEVTSNEPGWRESQWEVLIATSLGRPLTLQAQPFEPVPALDVRIELQAAHGPEAAYFARIGIPTTPAPVVAHAATSPKAEPVSSPSATPAVAASTTASQPSPGDSSEQGPALLAARGPLGFFDLDLTTGHVATSPAWKKMLGYGPAELADSHDAWRSLIHPEDTDALP
ncbi:MAG: PAS domain-containing protein, partial [Rariglobus sp.]